MKRKLNADILNKWILANGQNLAEAKIIQVTGYSLSTLQKMKDGSYPSCPGFAERAALVELTSLKMDDLFPVSKSGKAAS